jgi:hypothetical protein
MENGLSVEHRGHLIIVIRPGTEFSATYHKPEGLPNIYLACATIDPYAEPEAIYQFRADALSAATRKARELGWIV